jgi:hypothetical protein
LGRGLAVPSAIATAALGVNYTAREQVRHTVRVPAAHATRSTEPAPARAGAAGSPLLDARSTRPAATRSGRLSTRLTARLGVTHRQR